MYTHTWWKALEAWDAKRGKKARIAGPALQTFMTVLDFVLKRISVSSMQIACKHVFPISILSVLLQLFIYWSFCLDHWGWLSSFHRTRPEFSEKEEEENLWTAEYYAFSAAKTTKWKRQRNGRTDRLRFDVHLNLDEDGGVRVGESDVADSLEDSPHLLQSRHVHPHCRPR